MQLTQQDQRLVNVLNDSRFQFIFFSVLIYAIGIIEYKNFIVELYSYMGYPDSFNFSKSIVATVIYLSTTLLLFISSSRFIKAFTGLFIIIFLMPVLVLYQYSESGGGLFVLCSILFLLIINSNVTFRMPKNVGINLKGHPAILLVIAGTLILPFLLTFKINFDPELFLMGEKIYAIRAGLSDTGNFFTGYMLSPLSQVMLPILAIYGLSLRKWHLTILAFALTAILYMMIPQKSIFLGIFVVAFFYFFKDPIRKIAVFSGLIVTFLLIGMWLSHSEDSILFESLLFRRYLMVPAFLNHVYFDFFQGEKLYYSYSFLKHFVEYPYDINPSYLIGREFFEGRVLNANNGFLSDGFINFGIAGMIGTTFIAASLIKLFDGLSIDAKFFGLFFLILNLMRSSALPTTLLTHGMWFFVLLAMFLLRNKRLSLKQQ